MACQIIWSQESERTFDEIVSFVLSEWSEVAVTSFVTAVDKKLKVLQVFPRLGRRSLRHPNLYKTNVHKRVTLVYQLKPRKRQIILITFWNNWKKGEGVNY